MRRAHALLLSLLASASAVLAGGGAGPETVDALRSVAERTDFRATGSYDETVELLRRLATASPRIRLTDLGRSPEGRGMPLVVVSKDGLDSPAAARATGRPVVLIQNGIHAGEIDGKDACLMLLRDIALARYPELDGLVLLIVPIYNVDGHERVSTRNRPNQNGPIEGMGFRTTADGHDLNRDHLKLDTPEARAMIGLFNRWRPHLHVDTHVTDGVDHDWVLTWSWAEAPQLAAPLDAWLRGVLPAALGRTEAAGHRVGPYVDLLDREDPSRGFRSWVGQPRYATGYYPLRHRPSILVENHSYKPYRDRVLAVRRFLLELLRGIAAEPAALTRAVSAAEAATVALGRPDAAASDVTLTWRELEDGETIRFPVYAWSHEPSEVMGTPLLRYRTGEVREIEVPWIHRVEPDLTVARPRGYLVLPGWPAIERRLRDHGLRVERLTAGAELEVESIRLSHPRLLDPRRPSYQGRTQLTVDVTRAAETRTVPAGTLWIPADQPDFEIAVQLLEPESSDSLVAWGALSIVTERKEYIEPRILERLARDMLRSDPGVAEAWRRALEDPAFAADPWERWLWWYRRTEYWDDGVGLMPVFRRMAPLEVERTAWEPGR